MTDQAAIPWREARAAHLEELFHISPAAMSAAQQETIVRAADAYADTKVEAFLYALGWQHFETGWHLGDCNAVGYPDPCMCVEEGKPGLDALAADVEAERG